MGGKQGGRQRCREFQSEGTARWLKEQAVAFLSGNQPKLEPHLLLQCLVNPEAGEEGIPIIFSKPGFGGARICTSTPIRRQYSVTNSA